MDAPEQTFPAAGGIGEVSARVVAVSEAEGWTVAAAGPATFRLARTSRPAWARALTIVLLPFLGLGLIFLLVRKHEEGTISVFEDRQGTKIRAVGFADQTLLEALRAPTPAAAPASPKTTPPPPPRPDRNDPPPRIDIPSQLRSPDPATVAKPSTGPAHPDQDFGHTVVRPRTSHTDTSSTMGVTIHLPDGTTWAEPPGIVIGRQPTPPEQYHALTPVAVDDGSVSKTHAAIIIENGQVSVVDLHSTNGTVVLHAGDERQCAPGERTPVLSGAIICLGDLEIRTAANL